ncbi:MAG: hypothetical protein H3C27_08225 [Opitutaceae bacterium]|nr:hypothetical protein [Opitutaceae bacterium]
MHPDFPLFALALPLVPLLIGLLHRAAAARHEPALVRLGQAAGLTTALLAVFVTWNTGPAQLTLWAPAGAAWLHLALRLDLLSVTMAVLVAFLGAVVSGFSLHYLAGDPRRGKFLGWIQFTLAAVLTLVLAGSLGLILLAWVATSLVLHRLLLYFPQRTGAVFSARKKFVVSRLGDLSLLAAIILLYHHYGTTELPALFARAGAGDTAPLPLAAGFLVVCAALKSAQFPFHSWLPDTMETPTPVSALMHAGIINAGGFLIIRLSPLMVHAPAALQVLAIIGAVTAAFGAIVMLTQPSVKRALAYSTIAQMGFMLLQCGVGAFGLALLHIVAHSLYKAHAFLRAGSTIGAVPRAAVPLPTGAVLGGLLGAALLTAGGATALHLLAPSHARVPALFTLVVGLALAYGLSRTWSSGGGLAAALGGAAAMVGLAVASFALHGLAQVLSAGFPVHQPPTGLIVGLALAFLGLFLAQSLIWRAHHSPWGRRLHVHVLNGFYIGTLANRLLNRLWPRSIQS